VKFQKIKLEAVLNPYSGECTLDVRTKRFWSVTKDNCILYVRGFSPQCNRSELAVKRFCREDCDVKYFDVLYIPVLWTEDGMNVDVKTLQKLNAIEEIEG
jgi:hypothetical protein